MIYLFTPLLYVLPIISVNDKDETGLQLLMKLNNFDLGLDFFDDDDDALRSE